MLADELSDRHPLFSNVPSWMAERTPDAIAKSVAFLLFSAKEIMIIDPFIELRNLVENYTEPIKAMFALMVQNNKSRATIQLHYRTHPSRPPFPSIERDAKKWTAGVIPEDCFLELYEWNPDEILHDRFVLTNCGGIQSGRGFGATSPGQTVGFGLLGFEDCLERMSLYRRDSSKLTLAQPAVRIDSAGVAVQLE
jgi:hypothetical protein